MRNTRQGPNTTRAIRSKVNILATNRVPFKIFSRKERPSLHASRSSLIPHLHYRVPIFRKNQNIK